MVEILGASSESISLRRYIHSWRKLNSFVFEYDMCVCHNAVTSHPCCLFAYVVCVYIFDNAVASLTFCLLVNGTPVPVLML